MTIRTKCICSAPLNRQPFSENFDALICDRCGSHHFVASSKNNSRGAFKYDAHNDKYNEKSYLYGKRLRWAHLELLKRDWAERKVAEIGCYNGFFLDALQVRGANVFGFDLNQDAIAVGEELFGLTGRLANTLDRVYEQGPFDDVLCIDVVEHLDDPDEFLRQVSSLLKPDGQIVVAGPTIERRFHDKSDYPPHHKWWFSRQGLILSLELGGFEVQSVKIQRDGLLMARNFLGKVICGLSIREFYGDSSITAPTIKGQLAHKLYAAVSALGTFILTALGISYCSTIIIARKIATT